MNYLKYKQKEEYTKVWYRDRDYFTGGQLKYIAMIFMFLSHMAQTGFLYALGRDYFALADIFVFLGRISMPIFCFFTVQAVIYTKNFSKYVLRMLIFAIISEIPFDLAIYNQVFNWQNQNVFFTLLVAAIVIYWIDFFWKNDYKTILKILGILIVVSLGLNLAIIIKSDYNSKGVLAVVLLYIAKDSKILTALALILGFLFEFRILGYTIAVTYGFVYLAIPLIMLYNRQRGKQNKWAFYIFYPAHLFFIYLLKLLIL